MTTFGDAAGSGEQPRSGGCDVVIVINHSGYLTDFVRLNEAWISRYFKIEAADRELARNPDKVIADGGYIFTLLLQDKAVGVCALFRDAAGVFQLARMAVTPEHQGRGYGDQLLRAALGKLREIKAERVYLLSNTQLVPALALYRRHGFQVVREGRHPDYVRVDIVMEKML